MKAVPLDRDSHASLTGVTLDVDDAALQAAMPLAAGARCVRVCVCDCVCAHMHMRVHSVWVRMCAMCVCALVARVCVCVHVCVPANYH